MNTSKRAAALLLVFTVLFTFTACQPLNPGGNNGEVSQKGDVIITEAMASNNSTLQDSFGESPDWFELHNTTDHAVSLQGWYASDDPAKPDAFSLAHLTLQPNSYTVIYASGRDVFTENGDVHTNFKLSAGETLCLFSGGQQMDALEIPADLPTDLSCGTVAQTEGTVYFANATPAAANSDRYAANLADLSDNAVGIILSEWCPKNDGVFYDETGDCPDWVELRNCSSQAVDLTGFGLSDDANNPMRWTFPAVTLGAGEYLLVLLSGKKVEYTEDSLFLHADFKLKNTDGILRLSNASGIPIDQVTVLALPEWISQGKDTELTDEYRYYTVPTPGKANANNGFASLENALSASVERVYINEVCAVSSEDVQTLPDEDWIELYNNTSADVNLAGWSLSKDKDDLRDFIFPDVSIPAYGYLVISAGKIASTAVKSLNTGFRIGFAGNTLYLCNADGIVTDCFDTGYQRQSVTAGRVAGKASLERRFFSVPTKGTANDLANAAPAYAQPVQILTEQSAYITGNQTITLHTIQPNGRIYYTLDGTAPTDASTLYTAPIAIQQSASLRAVVYADGYLPSDVTTRTFLAEEPHSLGVVCLTCDPDDLFGYTNGIWADGPGWTSTFPHMGANYWKDWEREAYFEYFDTNGDLGIAFSAGIKNHGQYSRAEAQKSVSVNLKEEYGSDTVHYPFFGENGIKVFDNLLLRTGGQDWKTTNLVDAYCARVIEGQMDLDHMDEVPVAMYVNGEYWGMYYLREKINESYIYHHSGITADNLDAIKGNKNAETGTYDAHEALLKYIRTHNLADQQCFDYVASQIDIQEWTNYWIAESFFGNTDTGNIRFYNSRDDSAKWRWIFFDLDWALFPTTYRYNSVQQFLDPQGHGVGNMFSTTIAVGLFNNAAYKQYFIETYAQYMHTVFDTERMLTILDEMTAQVDSEMQRHCARWKNLSYDRWQNNVATLRKIVDERWEISANNLRKSFYLSDEQMAKLFPELYA